MNRLLLVGRGVPADRPNRQCRSGARQSHGRGMVSVELALGTLAAAAGLVLLTWSLVVVMLWTNCNDLATAVARQQARGDQGAVNRILKDRPKGAKVAVRQQAEQITVTVDLQAQPWADWLPAVPLSAKATVIREPT